MYTGHQRISAIKELASYQSADVGYHNGRRLFDFDWCGHRLQSCIDDGGEIISVYDKTTNRPRDRFQPSIVDSAIQLAVRVTCL